MDSESRLQKVLEWFNSDDSAENRERNYEIWKLFNEAFDSGYQSAITEIAEGSPRI